MATTTLSPTTKTEGAPSSQVYAFGGRMAINRGKAAPYFSNALEYNKLLRTGRHNVCEFLATII